MSGINDTKILKLKEEITKKKEELKNISRFSPVTNCSLELNEERYNINTLTKDKIIELMIKLNMYIISAQDLDLLEECVISGYKPTEWISDLKAKLLILSQKAEENKLKQMEAKLDKLLSNDKKVELELNEIENLLK